MKEKENEIDKIIKTKIKDQTIQGNEIPKLENKLSFLTAGSMAWL